MPRLPKPATEPGPLYVLWPERVLFIGRLGALSPHRHPASVCVIGLDAPLLVRTTAPAGRRHARTSIVAAGVVHAFDAGNQRVAALYNDPHRPWYRALAPRPVTGQLAPAAEDRLAGAVEALARAGGGPGPLDTGDFERTAADVLAADPEASAPPLDPRIRRVSELVSADVDQNRPIGVLAAAVGLSPDRLQHLFLAEIGVPLRRFRMWLRFRRTLAGVAAGASITAAALDAGFASSSHFSHSFRATFGLAASRVFGASTRPRVIAVAR